MSLLLQFDAASAAPTLSAVGPGARQVTSVPALRAALEADADVDVVVVGADVDLADALQLATEQRVARPLLAIVLVRSRVDSTVLTQALRAGVRDVVSSDDLGALAEACERSRALLREVTGQSSEPRAHSRGRVVTVFAAKGGCGKTTMATNLAAALANGGARSVCLVDLDLAFGDVAIAMQLLPVRTLADAAHLGSAPDEATVRSLVTPHSEGLDVIAAPLEPGASELLPAKLVGSLLTVLRGMYDYVVVDSPPAFTDHVLTAFDHSEHYVLLATLDVPALKNLKLTLETLGMLGYPRDRWHVALNRSDAKVGLTVDDVQKTLGHHIAVQIPSSRAVPSSINRGVLIALDSPGHPVSAAIRRFAGLLASADPANGPVVENRRQDRRGFSLLRRTAASS